MANILHMHVSDAVVDGVSRRITKVNHESGALLVDIFHEWAGMAPLDENTLLDGNVMSMLLFCMKQGLPLHVHGAMSAGSVRNLAELQRIWHRWRPEIYHEIEIRPGRIAETRRAEKVARAISAFSGGVDSTFTALRHAKVLPDHLRYPLTDVLMVHGFDVELQYPHYFDRLTQRVEPLLKELGLNLLTIRTNSKDWDRQNWQDSHGLELAACLHMVGANHQYGLIGSCEPYDSMCTPWGSGPVTDHLMGSDHFQIIHDGAGFSRTDKVEEVGRHPVACQTLKVCWAGADQSDNCGHCEKCVRTMMNFLACGYDIPPCFPEGLKPADVRRMKIYNGPQMNALKNIIAYAQTKGVNGKWIKWARARTRHGYSQYSPCLARQVLSRVLSRLGLKQPIKKVLQRLHFDNLIWD